MNPRLAFGIYSGFFILLSGIALHMLPSSKATQWFTLQNESLWSHLYLFVWPYFISTLILWSFINMIDPFKDNFLSRFYGLFVGIILIPLCFVLYTRADVTRHILALDIIIFALGIVIAEYVSYCSRTTDTKSKKNTGIVLTVLTLLIVIALNYFKIPALEKNILFTTSNHIYYPIINQNLP